MATNYEQATVTPFLPLTDSHLRIISFFQHILSEDLTVSDGLALDETLSDDEKIEVREIVEMAVLDNVDYTYLEYDEVPNEEGLYYVYFEDSGPSDLDRALLQRFLIQDFDEKEYPHIVIEGSFGCSKLRQGELGGFAQIITRDDIHYHNTGHWIDEKIEELKKPVYHVEVAVIFGDQTWREFIFEYIGDFEEMSHEDRQEWATEELRTSCHSAWSHHIGLLVNSYYQWHEPKL